MPDNVAMSPLTEELLVAASKSIKNSQSVKSSASQEAALTASVLVLDSLEENVHIFCSSRLEKPALMSLLLFQYPYSMQFALYQKALANQLAQCADCARKYHIALHHFSAIMSNVYAYDQSDLNDIVTLIQQWNHARLVSSLRSIDQKKLELHNLSGLELQRQLIPLLECLSAPQYFADEAVMDSFQSIFSAVLALPENIFQPKTLLPGVIHFLFSHQKELQSWALRVIDHMDNDSCLAENFDDLQVQAMEDVVKTAVESRSSDNDIKRFWFFFSVLVRVLDKSVFIERLSGRPSDIIKFLTRCILARPRTSLPYVLLALGMALDKLGSMFWPIVNPISAPELVDAIISNHFFSLPESWSKEVDTIMGFQHDIEDMVTWIMLLINSKPDSTMLKCEHAIATKLIQLHGNMTGTEPEQFILSEIVDIFAHSLSVDIEDKPPFVYHGCLEQRLEMRILCSQFGSQVVDAYAKFKSLNNFIRANSLATLYRSILLDVMSAMATYSQPTYNSEQLPSVVSLWPLLNNTMPEDRSIIIQVLRAITHVTFIRHDSSAAAGDEDKKHSEFVLKNASVSLSHIGDFSSDVLMSVLEDDRALLSIFMNMFSMDANVYRFSLEVLFQAYDACDRSTALSALLASNLQRSLKLYTEAIGGVRIAGSYTPILGVVRVTAIVANCLLGVKRVLNSKSYYQELGHDLTNFWCGAWDLLRHIFKTNAIWDMNIHDSILLEFRRDLLDLIQQLISSFQIIEIYVSEREATEGQHSFLIQPILNCIIEMAAIMFETDDSHMLSYFEIIISTLNVMKLFNIKTDCLEFIITKFMSSRCQILSNDQKAALLEAQGQSNLPAFIKNPRLPQSVSEFSTSKDNLTPRSHEFKVVKVGDDEQKSVNNGAISAGPSENFHRSDQSEFSALKPKENEFESSPFHINMDALYREVLSWDYHSVTPNPINLKTKKPFPIPLKVDSYSFSSADDYQLFFWSRLIMGCWGDILLSKQLTPKKPFSISMDKKVSLGHGAYSINATVNLSQNKDDVDLCFKEADLVVLSFFNGSTDIPDYLARVNRVTILGSDLIELTLRVEHAEIPEHLRPSSVFKVGTLSKVEAEYRALMDVPLFNSFQKILRAESAYLAPVESFDLEYKAKYSLANFQAKTASTVARSNGISLINGYGCLHVFRLIFFF